MAIALVTAVHGIGKRRALTPGNVQFVITIYFAGGEVSDDVEGQAFYADVNLVSVYTLADLKAGMVAAAVQKGTDLGLSVLSTDVDVPTYESGV